MNQNSSAQTEPAVFQGATFETELQVRPDDIDMNQHVHGSKYMDYVLAARYDQMERCYKMSMGEFNRLGFAWFIRTAHLQFKRPLRIGERFVVRTRVSGFEPTGVRVSFEIVKLPARKLCCDGYFNYTMVDATTGRAEVIPPEIVAKYSI